MLEKYGIEEAQGGSRECNSMDEVEL